MAWYSILADLVLVVHLGFVIFVVLGGFLVLHWPRLAWLHLPAAAWGTLIEFAGWVCPLTPLEQRWRERAGEAGYRDGFIEHYLTSWLYPSGLSRTAQIVLGVLVLVVNGSVYALLIRRRRARPQNPTRA